MQRIWYVLVFLLGHCCFVLNLYAQEQSEEPLTIEQAVHEAVEKNLGLLAERYNMAIADAQITTARLRPNPVLTLGADLPDHSVFHSGTNPFDETAHVDFVLERGGKRERRIAVAEQARGVAQMKLLNSVRTLILDVQNACVDLLQAKANLTLAQDNLRVFNDIVQVNTVRVRSGDLAPVELERTTLAALQFENEVRQAESALLVARYQLQMLLGRATPSPTVDIVGDFRHDEQPIAIATIHDEAFQFRPDLAALKRDQAQSAADLQLQIAQGTVDYTLGAGLSRQQGNVKDGNLYGLSFSVPIPVFNRNQGEIERAQQEEEQITAKIRALETAMQTEVESAYQQYLSARDVRQRIETEMLTRARNIRQTTEYSYRRGQSSFLEFLDAQRAFNETMKSYNDARANYAKSLYLIDAVEGKAVRQ